MSETRLKIAVFIDFDNIEIGVKTTLGGHFDVGAVLEALKERGEVVTKIAYGDWTRAGDYSRSLTQHAIHMVQRNLTPGGDKNGADINLALDALEMAFTHSHINAFVIVGGDSDFMALVEKLKQYDRKVFVVGGRAFTSIILQKNCTEFIAYENLVGATPRSKTGGRAGARPGEAPAANAVPLIKRALKVLADREVSPQLGVLKSTLLQLDSTFSEREYGASTFRDFVQRLARAGYLTLKGTERNIYVELREGVDGAATAAAGQAGASGAAGTAAGAAVSGGAAAGTPAAGGKDGGDGFVAEAGSDAAPVVEGDVVGSAAPRAAAPVAAAPSARDSRSTSRPGRGQQGGVEPEAGEAGSADAGLAAEPAAADAAGSDLVEAEAGSGAHVPAAASAASTDTSSSVWQGGRRHSDTGRRGSDRRHEGGAEVEGNRRAEPRRVFDGEREVDGNRLDAPVPDAGRFGRQDTQRHESHRSHESGRHDAGRGYDTGRGQDGGRAQDNRQGGQQGGGRRDQPAAGGDAEVSGPAGSPPAALRFISEVFQRPGIVSRWPLYLRQVKQILRGVDESFDERRYGFTGIVEALRYCQREGLFRLDRDRQGVLRVYPGPTLQRVAHAGPQGGIDGDVTEAVAAAGREERAEAASAAEPETLNLFPLADADASSDVTADAEQAVVVGDVALPAAEEDEPIVRAAEDALASEAADGVADADVDADTAGDAEEAVAAAAKSGRRARRGRKPAASKGAPPKAQKSAKSAAPKAVAKKAAAAKAPARAAKTARPRKAAK